MDPRGPAAQWERLRFALARPERTDGQTVRDLDLITRGLGELERAAENPRTLFPLVRTHLDMLTALLRATTPPHIMRDLCSLAAETSAMAGWLRWDQGAFEEADAYFGAGLVAAREAGDRAIGAYLIGCLADRPFNREKPDRRLEMLAANPMGFCNASDATPVTRAWLYGLEGGAYALLGRRDDFQRVQERAGELLATSYDPDEERRPRVPFYDKVMRAEQLSAGLDRMGDFRGAREVLEDVAHLGKGRMAMWLDLDAAYAAFHDAEPELGVEYARKALGAASSAGVKPILDYLHGLQPELRIYAQEPSVRGLMDDLRIA